MDLNEQAWWSALRVSGGPLAGAATGVAAKRLLGVVLQLCDIGTVRRAPFFLVVATMAAVAFFQHEQRGGGRAEAGSPGPFLWQRHSAIHGRGNGFRD